MRVHIRFITKDKVMNYDKFIYVKHQYPRNDTVNHRWYLINKKTRQGVHFHGDEYLDNYDLGSYTFCLWDNNEFRFTPHGV